MFDQDRADALYEITNRLNAIEHDLPRLAVRDLMHRVHSLKGLAQAYEFRALVTLAHALEAQLAGQGKAALTATYLDRMHDALEVGPGDHPRCADVLLATVGVRLTAA